MKKRDEAIFHLPMAGSGLPFFWVAMGEQIRRTPSYRWHGLRREQQPRLLWQLTLRGEGTIQIGSAAPRHLHRGEGFLARIPSDHCYYYSPGSPAWKFIWVIWSGPALEAMADVLMAKEAVRIIKVDPEVSEMRFLRSQVRLGAEAGGDPWQNSLEAYRLLIAVCRASSGQPVSRGRPLRTLTQVETLLRRDPASPVGKGGLSESLGLSRFQLYRTLKQQSGLSPHEWTARKRIVRACHLLRTTRFSIAEVAVKSGLPDANYFARFFRARTGFSPRDWRKLFSGR
jgi:AraC-like DNA-binding protein